MATSNAVGMASLVAMLTANGVSKNSYTRLKQTFKVDDLLSGKADAMTAYIVDQPYQLEKQGVPYTIFSPVSYGFDFYSDLLFTSHQFFQNNPQLVERFYQASMRGWEYAFAHMEETVDLILNRYNTQNRSREDALYQKRVLENFNHSTIFISS